MSKRTIEINDLFKIKGVNAPRVSPDGRRVLFSVQTVDPDRNRYLAHLWVAEIGTGELRQFTQGAVRDGAASWSPDGKRLAFLRTQEGVTHVWLMPADGGEAHQLDSLDEGVPGAPHWSPQGDRLALTFRPTHPDWTRSAQKQRSERGLSAPPRVITQYRHKFDVEGLLREAARGTEETRGEPDRREGAGRGAVILGREP